MSGVFLNIDKEKNISRSCLKIIILPRILLQSELFIIIMNIGRKNDSYTRYNLRVKLCGVIDIII